MSCGGTKGKRQLYSYQPTLPRGTRAQGDFRVRVHAPPAVRGPRWAAALKWVGGGAGGRRTFLSFLPSPDVRCWEGACFVLRACVRPTHPPTHRHTIPQAVHKSSTRRGTKPRAVAVVLLACGAPVSDEHFFWAFLPELHT